MSAVVNNLKGQPEGRITRVVGASLFVLANGQEVGVEGTARFA
jgi:hypothetical protein